MQTNIALMARSLAGFNVLPVQYAKDVSHYLYVREHAGSKKAAPRAFPDGRTLFVVNVPPDATERELVLFFKHAGTIERVVFDHDDSTLDDQPEEDEDDDSDADTSEDDADEAMPDADKPQKRRKGAHQVHTLHNANQLIFLL